MKAPHNWLRIYQEDSFLPKARAGEEEVTNRVKSLQCLVEGSEALTRTDLENPVYVSKRVPFTLKLQGKLQRFSLGDITA